MTPEVYFKCVSCEGRNRCFHLEEVEKTARAASSLRKNAGLVWASNLKPLSPCHGRTALKTEIKEWLRISQTMAKIIQDGIKIPHYFIRPDLVC